MRRIFLKKRRSNEYLDVASRGAFAGMTDCPPGLRGDVSKWLFEINTGVYVGSLSARVRDALWSRICENLSAGRATMSAEIYSPRKRG